jgi:Holliday junction resolvase-like predicted endonuclease
MFYAKHSKKEVGLLGENIASLYLSKFGYKILGRNYKKKFDEIDIITRSPNGMLVFVEVKTFFIRNIDRNDFMLSPEENFTKSKSFKISRVCQSFAAENPDLINKNGWRIDLLSIAIKEADGRVIIKHFKNMPS